MKMNTINNKIHAELFCTNIQNKNTERIFEKLFETSIEKLLSDYDEYDEILAVASHIEEIRSYDTLIELSEFDSGEFVNQQLQKEYAMEAYEENLENCINSASEDAQNIVLDLTQTAKDDIDELLSELQEYCDKYANFIDNLRAREIKKISPKIDNT